MCEEKVEEEEKEEEGQGEGEGEEGKEEHLDVVCEEEVLQHSGPQVTVGGEGLLDGVPLLTLPHHLLHSSPVCGEE